jgi:GNAT superfamily N-acetyltransferase
MTFPVKAPVGRFVATIYELAAQGPEQASPHFMLATPEDLDRLAPLLAPHVDHERRLAEGDSCLYMADEGGHPIGLLWLNLCSHSDRHFGRWSAVSDSIAYYNQLFVDPAARRGGIGTSLVRAAAQVAASAGRHRLRAAVVAPNPASIALHRKLGFQPVVHMVGLRAGDLGTLRLSVPCRARVDKGSRSLLGVSDHRRFSGP